MSHSAVYLAAENYVRDNLEKLKHECNVHLCRYDASAYSDDEEFEEKDWNDIIQDFASDFSGDENLDTEENEKADEIVRDILNLTQQDKYGNHSGGVSADDFLNYKFGGDLWKFENIIENDKRIIPFQFYYNEFIENIKVSHFEKYDPQKILERLIIMGASMDEIVFYLTTEDYFKFAPRTNFKPIGVVCYKNNLELLRILHEELGFTYYEEKNHGFWCVLEEACVNNNVEMLRYLVDVLKINTFQNPKRFFEHYNQSEINKETFGVLMEYYLAGTIHFEPEIISRGIGYVGYLNILTLLRAFYTMCPDEFDGSIVYTENTNTRLSNGYLDEDHRPGRYGLTAVKTTLKRVIVEDVINLFDNPEIYSEMHQDALYEIACCFSSSGRDKYFHSFFGGIEDLDKVVYIARKMRDGPQQLEISTRFFSEYVVSLIGLE